MSGASSSSAAQPASTSPPDGVLLEQIYKQALWQKEQEDEATRRAVKRVGPAVVASDDNALRDVHHLLGARGVDAAAEAFRLVADVATSCPDKSQKFVKALEREVRDVFVLRCLCQIEPRGYGDRDSFLDVVAKAFGPTLSRVKRDLFLHSHRKLTWGTPWGFLSKTQQQRRLRRRRFRPNALDRQVGQNMTSAVDEFLAGKDCSDRASASDEDEFGTTRISMEQLFPEFDHN